MPTSIAERSRLGARPLDPRGTRAGAAMTSVVLAVVLLTAPGALATLLLAAQTTVFAVGAGLGVHRTPQAWAFARLVRPHLAPPVETEDPRPPRFAQGVGLAFSAAGLLALLGGATILGLVAVGCALGAALLNAGFGVCLGCDLYLALKRLAPIPG